MRVHIGTDHAGYELKQHLLDVLRADGHDVVDHGAVTFDADDDYPPFCFAAAEAALADPGSLGIVIGGSGNGEQIAANRVPGVRAALVWNTETARLARSHNDAQVMAIGARQHTAEEAADLVRTFLSEPFSNDPRHRRRIDMVEAYPTGHRQAAGPAGQLPTGAS